MEEEIPIIDFSSYGFDKEHIEEEHLQKLAKEVYGAFSNVGYMYLKNHGMPKEIIKTTKNAGEQFFALDDEQKKKYAWDLEAQQGWRSMAEIQNPDRPVDKKETFNIIPQIPRAWTIDEIPEFTDVMTTFHKQCNVLALRLLEVIAVGLGLTRNFFTDLHKPYERSNRTALRLALYPGIKDNSDIQPNQVRCGEHTDYIAFSFIFQDDTGGLELFSKKGHYVKAPPVEDTIVVITADMLQRWTSDKFISTKHRVVFPEDEDIRKRDRCSMIVFVMPDEDCMIECIDGKSKYPPINANDYLTMRFAEML